MKIDYWTVMFWVCCTLVGACVAMSIAVTPYSRWAGAVLLFAAVAAARAATDAWCRLLTEGAGQP